MANETLGLGLFDECKKYEIIFLDILCKFKQPMTLSESVPLAPKQFHFSKIDCQGCNISDITLTSGRLSGFGFYDYLEFGVGV